jgi:hypothetical protein
VATQLAYDADLFARAAAALATFASLETKPRGVFFDTASKYLETLFQPVVSGTHAQVTTRLKLLSDLLERPTATARGLVARCLQAA